MSDYTLDLYFVGTDVDDALSATPFLEEEHARDYRDAEKEVGLRDFLPNPDRLNVYSATIAFSLDTSRVAMVDDPRDDLRAPEWDRIDPNRDPRVVVEDEEE